MPGNPRLCRHSHVDLVRKITLHKITASHGDVEDMELSDTTQVTGDY